MPRNRPTTNRPIARVLPHRTPGAKIMRRRRWERSVEDSIVLVPGERFHHAYRVEIPVKEAHEWVRVILAITSARLLVLMGGHLQVEADIGAVAHAYRDGGLAYFTLRGEEQSWKVAVRAGNRAEKLQQQLVSRAQRRLGRHPGQTVPVFLAAIVQAAAEAQARDQRGSHPEESNEGDDE